ncbi:hypothetical protein [Pseudarthrobacter sp. NPDC080039]|uniref:hypothetical protein n=1 Tax=unclassified Pseudarthrobacter TaxID=2647000 RepID=UPI00344D0C2F
MADMVFNIFGHDVNVTKTLDGIAERATAMGAETAAAGDVAGSGIGKVGTSATEASAGMGAAALSTTGALAGIAAAAAASSALVGAALGALPLVFAGAGLLMVGEATKTNAGLKQQFADAGNSIKADMLTATEPMTTIFGTIATNAATALHQLGPLLHDTFDTGHFLREPRHCRRPRLRRDDKVCPGAREVVPGWAYAGP